MPIVIVAYAFAILLVSRWVTMALRADRIQTTHAAVVLAAIWAALPLLPIVAGVSSITTTPTVPVLLMAAAAVLFVSMFLGLRWLLARAGPQLK